MWLGKQVHNDALRIVINVSPTLYATSASKTSFFQNFSVSMLPITFCFAIDATLLAG